MYPAYVWKDNGSNRQIFLKIEYVDLFATFVWEKKNGRPFLCNVVPYSLISIDCINAVQFLAKSDK